VSQVMVGVALAVLEGKPGVGIMLMNVHSNP
jgi:hypothetical protein